MKKVLALLISTLSIITPFLYTTPVFAACAMQYPTIGIIASVSTDQYGYTTFSLKNADVFNGSAFGSSGTNIDQYNALAVAYKQNNYQVPSLYAYQFQSYETPSTVRSNLKIGVLAAALSSVSYQPGDIIIQGPPGGASCTQDGFTGFFGQTGVIQSAIATDSGYASYTYGSDSLNLSATSPQYNCTTTGVAAGGQMCQVPMQYSLNGNTAVIKPGENHQFSGTSHAIDVSLIQSNYTTLSGNMWMEDFNPTQLLHVLTFASPTSASATLAASPASGPAPLNVNFQAGPLDSSGTYFINYGDGSTGFMQVSPTEGQCSGTPCYHNYMSSHTYTAAGSYTATLSTNLVTSAAAGKCNALQNPYCNILNTKVVSVTATSNSGTLSVSPLSGQAPLTVTISYASQSAFFGGAELDMGDGHILSDACWPGSTCSGTQTYTYTSPGSYTIKLIGNGEGSNVIAASTNVTVSGTTPVNNGITTYSASTKSGSVPLAVSFSVGNQSFTNIDFGDGNKAAPINTSCTVGTPGCGIWNVNHTYIYPGNYSALLMNGSQVVATIPIAAGVAPQYINPNPLPSSGSCPVISRNLSRGSSGSDVSALQQFFISNGMIPSSLLSSPSGYFGALTEIAVQQWQAAHGLASSGTPATTGYGAVGPRTRTSLSNCKN